MFALQIKRLTKSFGSGKSAVNAVRGIDLEVKEGEIFGFLGPNGAGKTTTMRMLTTLVRPTSGEAIIAGHDLLREPEKVRCSIGYVSQTGGLERSATARENLILQAKLHGMTQLHAEERAQELIDALELNSFADRLVETYSGGQRRRADIALGMMHSPKILFLDEPTVGLDPQSRARIWEEIKKLKKTGTTVFITTHYLDEADALCDRLAIIDHGTVVAVGTCLALKQQISGDIITIGLPAQLGTSFDAHQLFKSHAAVREITHEADSLKLFVEEGEVTLPSILKVLDAAGIALKTVSLTRPTLDDVFLKKTGRSLKEEAL